jgi:dolichyl-phosphate-mannose-protein mannosyltransferase
MIALRGKGSGTEGSSVNLYSTRRVLDVVALVAVLVAAAGFRLIDLGLPDRIVFDESYYAQDACTYLALGQEVCGGISEASWVHPPLGKRIIALGIALGGYEPVAWRFPVVVAGVIAVGALFLLTRRLTGSVAAAGVAAGVLALDPLSIVSSRVAMLDMFLTAASILALLFAVLHRDTLRHRQANRIPALPPWLVAAGFACGVAIATKWSGILVLAIVAVLVIAWEIDAGAQAGATRLGTLRRLAPAIAICLVVLPGMVYIASYIGVLEGEILAVPWQQDAWPRVFGGRQLRMATFHAGLDATHPYASPSWSWLLGKRAVTYYFETDSAGRYREILAFANLALWLPGAAAAILAALAFAVHRQVRRAELVVAATVIGSYLPWLLLSINRPFVFLHYIVPTIPFLAMAIGWAVTLLPVALRRLAAAGVLIIALGVALFWAPLLYGWPLSYDEWRQRILFTDCDPIETVSGRFEPRAHPGPPPDGWCWV